MKKRILIILILILSSCTNKDDTEIKIEQYPIMDVLVKEKIDINDHAGLREIFMRVFEANMKNLFVLLQGHHFISLALNGILEESVTLDQSNFPKWIKEKMFLKNVAFPKIHPELSHEEVVSSVTIDAVKIVFFIGEQNFEPEIQELLNDNNIIPAFITSLVPEKINLYTNTKEFNAFMKNKYKIDKEIEITSHDSTSKNKMIFYIYTLPENEVKKFSNFCNDLKLNFDENTIELYCASKKNTPTAILCHKSFCLDSTQH
jgi:hypothetical protein